jgi:hypothetical protein
MKNLFPVILILITLFMGSITEELDVPQNRSNNNTEISE